MEEKLMEAISAGSILVITYKNTQRMIEPHTLGINRNGSVQLCAWQLTEKEPEDECFPETVEKGSDGWRLFTVDKIGDPMLTNGEFEGTRDGYNPNDSRFPTILATR